MREKALLKTFLVLSALMGNAERDFALPGNK
jgi:hypothetical protein